MIYIAGKITGLPFDEVSEKFQRVEAKLHQIGVQVINPLKLGIPESWTWEDQLSKCIEVIQNRATAIYLISDWKHSKSARLEFEEVVRINSGRNRRILIYFEESHGIQDIVRDIRDGIAEYLIPEYS